MRYRKQSQLLRAEPRAILLKKMECEESLKEEILRLFIGVKMT